MPGPSAAVGDKTEAEEANDHHCPGGRLGHRPDSAGQESVRTGAEAKYDVADRRKRRDPLAVSVKIPVP